MRKIHLIKIDYSTEESIKEAENKKQKWEEMGFSVTKTTPIKFNVFILEMRKEVI